MRKKILMRKSLWILLFCCICLSIRTDAEAAQQTITVGCVDIENFLELDANGTASGYGAEYLKEIAKYTNWKYEYKQGSWSECLEWLKKGEIDLLMPAEFSEERAGEYLFSDVECCLDYAALIGLKSEERYYYEDYEAFDGMVIGMIKDNYLNAIFEQYALNNQFSYHAVYYNTGTELTDALEQKKVDAIVNGNMEFTSSQKNLARIAYMPAFFITDIQNHALMEELNKSLHKILLNNPYYTASLHAKYYSAVDRQSIEFTRQESDYIREKGKVTILLEDNNYPMEWYDKEAGTWKGIYVDIIKRIENKSGLQFEFVFNDGTQSAWKAVKSGSADVWGSAYVPNIDRAAGELSYTSFYYDCSYSLIGKKEKSLNLSEPLTVTILETEEGVRSLIKEQYPNWNIITHKSIEAGLEKIEKAEADLTVVNTWGLSVSESLLDRELIVIDREAMRLPVCFGMSESNNPLLVSVLNKAILKIDSHEIQECVLNSILMLKQKVTLRSLLEKYPFYAGGIILILVVIIMTGIFMLYRNMIQLRQNRILQEKNKELENAVAIQEQLRIEAQTDALTGLKNKGNGEYTCQKYLDEYPDHKHGILIMDLDNFKLINDTFGHVYGDAILKKFGHILIEAAGINDVVARIGGDEFLMFMTCIESREQVIQQVESIYNNISRQEEGADAIPISCSIGIVISESPHKKYSEIFFEADQVLYEAKKDGKNKYLFL